ncbi:hypothetical protein CYMTET_39912 [Cymbomonas tetramitiformis]|uniref:Uncharacterized protein n=1 Tax=Cymbomonas tetramitiformis TaxID=36881 RepID=A0AAE0C958_9CHLO|nr:hypothetical protein CYMTET_39912 [Cymbomonas tetramitiformis]
MSSEAPVWLSGSGTLSPKGIRKWEPNAPFDASSSRNETLTRTYDARSDPHLSSSFRSKIKMLQDDQTGAKSYSSERDRQHEIMENARGSEQERRGTQLSGLSGRRPELYQRTWDLQADQKAYYPSLLSAGGADLCPIKKTLQIDPSPDKVPNHSLLACSTATFDVGSLRSDLRKSMGSGTMMSNDSVLSATLRKHLCSPHQTTVDI